ncbi:acylneuraminate cytidylyltransferase family protein, partial [Alphaproteobacteria bacterium]|nr:acylneuraminate cytidylyltransferase family protein [Alphaproteobacteria bacterium]
MIIVVPARGGSKRVPLKNIHSLMGKPLLTYTLEAISESRLCIPTYVSTDNHQIASLARSYPGIEVLIRPQNISHDNATTESALLHVLDIVTASGKKPKWLMTLPPTSPFRSPETIRKFAEEAMSCENSIDSLMSVTEN